MPGKTILCAAKLHANQLERHLELFEYIDEVDQVLLVRHEGLSGRLSKVKHIPFAPGSLLKNGVGMARTLRQTLRQHHVDLVVGFNPVPWGTIAHSFGKASAVPTCLSLIGMDYLQLHRWWGAPFRRAVRGADVVTVTGERMTRGLVDLGVERQKIRVLPHSVDLERFRPVDSGGFDIIAVGQLIRRKRMDVLIDAVAQCRDAGLELKVGVLGQGPLLSELRAQAERLGLGEAVEFLGYRNDVETLLAGARVFCLASEWEGVPFAMMEAMAAGVVPVVTDVGTISDWVTHGKNGRIAPVGDPDALAKNLRALLGDSSTALSACRQSLLDERGRLGFPAGARVWREILGLD